MGHLYSIRFTSEQPNDTYLCHHGILGQKWGVRRFQNKDGSLTAEGKSRYYSEGERKNLAKRIEQGKSLEDTSQFKDAMSRFEKENKSDIEKFKAAEQERNRIDEDWYDDNNKERKKYAEKFARQLTNEYGKDFDNQEEIYNSYLDAILYDDLDQGETQELYFKDHPKEAQHYSQLSNIIGSINSKLNSESKRISSEYLGEYGNERVNRKSILTKNDAMAMDIRKKAHVY